MNLAHRPKVVLLGFMSHFPVAGVAWQTVHYLIGLQKLGCDVFYVEAHGCTPSKLMQHAQDDGPARAAEHIAAVMARFGLQNHWAYHAIYDSRWFGLTESQLKNLYRDAALIINLHGSHLPTEELTATNRLVFLETDPVDLQIEIFNGKKEALEYLKPHCAFYTFGENLGAPDCRVPKPAQFNFIPTRQPVVMEFWEQHGHGVGDAFTTIGNWRQPWREVQFNGETLRWSKHFEFEKFISLPKKFPAQPFELALSSYDDHDQKRLEQHGWRVRPGLELSRDLDTYRDYIGASRGEFTVAKEQNIRLRSGWFSDRAVTYLAAGRPVITQDTAFGNILPTGHGLFSFATMDELCAAVEKINAGYEKHSRAARELAREFFSHEVVLGKMLRELGVGAPSTRSARPGVGETNVPSRCSALPASLVLAAISRWPTRLPEQTIQTALALPTPVALGSAPAPGAVNRALAVHRADDTDGTSVDFPRVRVRREGAPDSSRGGCAPQTNRASIILITHNGLAYTKLCLTTLLAHWRAGDELILVDNASTDGTAEFLRDLARANAGRGIYAASTSELPGASGLNSTSPDTSELKRPAGRAPGADETAPGFIRVIINSTNLGFAAANNQALAAATGEIFVLLNNDTLLPAHWRDTLLAHLADESIGLVGPVTNRTCNEAQIDAPYQTFAEFENFAAARARLGAPSTRSARPEGLPPRAEQVLGAPALSSSRSAIPMLAMFCVALRRDVFQKIGALDEQFEVGMFEDDDYSRRVRAAGFKVVCAENCFVHHFGQASFGELCTNGEYDRVLAANRARFEAKWKTKWQPHARRLTPEYAQLRQRLRAIVAEKIPAGANVAVISKGDDELLKFAGRTGWHFPQAASGAYANIYPADSAEAVAQLEALRRKGATHLVIPSPAFWWLAHYADFKTHLAEKFSIAVCDEATCLVFDLKGGANG